jgi:hypothetical protein
MEKKSCEEIRGCKPGGSAIHEHIQLASSVYLRSISKTIKPKLAIIGQNLAICVLRATQELDSAPLRMESLRGQRSLYNGPSSFTVLK